jgi:hypothetical protein
LLGKTGLFPVIGFEFITEGLCKESMVIRQRLADGNPANIQNEKIRTNKWETARVLHEISVQKWGSLCPPQILPGVAENRLLLREANLSNSRGKCKKKSVAFSLDFVHIF